MSRPDKEARSWELYSLNARNVMTDALKGTKGSPQEQYASAAMAFISFSSGS